MNEKAKPVASTDVIVGDLQKFFASDQSRTTVGRLREMFDTIEKLRDGGMSLEKIRLVLEKNNLKISFATLTKSLQRIRVERGVEVATPKEQFEQKPKRKPAKATGVQLAMPDVTDVVAKEKSKAPGKLDLVDQEKIGVLNKYGCDTTDVADVFSSMLNKGK